MRWIGLFKNFGYSEVQAARRIRHMREAFPESTVSISTNLIESVERMPDPEDRHVAAVAIHLRAQVVVTANLRHFPQQVFARHHIAVRSPDDFLVGQFHRNPQRILEVLSAQASATRQTLVEIQKNC